MIEEAEEVKRIKQQRRVVILRDDHIGDPIGGLFLDPDALDEDGIIARLRDYLGARVRIVKAELSAERAEIEVETQALADEATRLAATARDLSRKGARRGALALFRDALELDPLNREAALGLGLAMAEAEQYSEALAMLKRAREAGPDDVEVLHAIGSVCISTDRIASAITYLERAFDLDPGHFGVRRALAELGRKPKPPQRQRNAQPPVAAAKPSRSLQ
jgi:tetratricopeptide (TPR) repeat protein